MWQLVRSRILFCSSMALSTGNLKMSTFHCHMEQSLGLFVCFCKMLMYLYREGKWAFSKLFFISLSDKKGQCVDSLLYSAYMQGALSCPSGQCQPLLVASKVFFRWVWTNSLPVGTGKVLHCDPTLLPTRHEMLNTAKHNQVGQEENAWAASHPTSKGCTVCWSYSGAGKSAGREMSVAEGKGRVAAGNKVMPVLVTLVNSYVVLGTANELMPILSWLAMQWLGRNKGVGVKRFVSEVVLEELAGFCRWSFLLGLPLP